MKKIELKYESDKETYSIVGFDIKGSSKYATITQHGEGYNHEIFGDLAELQQLKKILDDYLITVDRFNQLK